MKASCCYFSSSSPHRLFANLSGTLWQAIWGITSEVACTVFSRARPLYLGLHTPLDWLIPPISLETAGHIAGRLAGHHCSVTQSSSCLPKEWSLSTVEGQDAITFLLLWVSLDGPEGTASLRSWILVQRVTKAISRMLWSLLPPLLLPPLLLFLCPQHWRVRVCSFGKRTAEPWPPEM